MGVRVGVRVGVRRSGRERREGGDAISSFNPYSSDCVGGEVKGEGKKERKSERVSERGSERGNERASERGSEREWMKKVHSFNPYSS